MKKRINLFAILELVVVLLLGYFYFLEHNEKVVGVLMLANVVLVLASFVFSNFFAKPLFSDVEKDKAKKR